MFVYGPTLLRVWDHLRLCCRLCQILIKTHKKAIQIIIYEQILIPLNRSNTTSVTRHVISATFVTMKACASVKWFPITTQLTLISCSTKKVNSGRLVYFKNQNKLFIQYAINCTLKYIKYHHKETFSRSLELRIYCFYAIFFFKKMGSLFFYLLCPYP